MWTFKHPQKRIGYNLTWRDPKFCQTCEIHITTQLSTTMDFIELEWEGQLHDRGEGEGGLYCVAENIPYFTNEPGL